MRTASSCSSYRFFLAIKRFSWFCSSADIGPGPASEGERPRLVPFAGLALVEDGWLACFEALAAPAAVLERVLREGDMVVQSNRWWRDKQGNAHGRGGHFAGPFDFEVGGREAPARRPYQCRGAPKPDKRRQTPSSGAFLQVRAGLQQQYEGLDKLGGELQC